MATVVVPVDGLLRTDRGGPFITGQALFRTLVADYRVVIASPVSEEETKGILRRAGLLGWARIHEGSVLAALRHERPGAFILFCITPDPDEAAAIFEQGISVLQISGTDFVNPKWRPERKNWDQIKQEADNE